MNKDNKNFGTSDSLRNREVDKVDDMVVDMVAYMMEGDKVDDKVVDMMEDDTEDVYDMD